MKKKKLLIQVAIVTSLFLAAVLIAVEVVLYMSTQNVYLRSKNEMITRDLKAMSSTVMMIVAKKRCLIMSACCRAICVSFFCVS